MRICINRSQFGSNGNAVFIEWGRSSGMVWGARREFNDVVCIYVAVPTTQSTELLQGATFVLPHTDEDNQIVYVSTILVTRKYTQVPWVYCVYGEMTRELVSVYKVGTGWRSGAAVNRNPAVRGYQWYQVSRGVFRRGMVSAAAYFCRVVADKLSESSE